MVDTSRELIAVLCVLVLVGFLIAWGLAQAGQERAHDDADSWLQFHSGLRLQNDELQLSNDRLRGELKALEPPHVDPIIERERKKREATHVDPPAPEPTPIPPTLDGVDTKQLDDQLNKMLEDAERDSEQQRILLRGDIPAAQPSPARKLVSKVGHRLRGAVKHLEGK